jgi:hypothetical protein
LSLVSCSLFSCSFFFFFACAAYLIALPFDISILGSSLWRHFKKVCDELVTCLYQLQAVSAGGITAGSDSKDDNLSSKREETHFPIFFLSHFINFDDSSLSAQIQICLSIQAVAVFLHIELEIILIRLHDNLKLWDTIYDIIYAVHIRFWHWLIWIIYCFKVTELPTHELFSCIILHRPLTVLRLHMGDANCCSPFI